MSLWYSDEHCDRVCVYNMRPVREHVKLTAYKRLYILHLCNVNNVYMCMVILIGIYELE